MSCAVEGCPGTRRIVRGLCTRHYQRLLKHGDPSVSLTGHGLSTREQILRLADQSGGVDACWPWQGEIDRFGYPKVHIRSEPTRFAHRLAYLTMVGPLDDDWLQVDHACHDPQTCLPGPTCPHRRCVNPLHLEAVTPRVNVERSGSVAAVNMLKVSCPRGHPLSGDNLLHAGKGHRKCRVCAAAHSRRYYAEGRTGYRALTSRSKLWASQR